MKTAKAATMEYEDICTFSRNVDIINRYRSSKQIPRIPGRLRTVKIQGLTPACDLASPDPGDLSGYRERLRLVILELQIIDMIKTGIKPTMTPEEDQRLQEDLEEINRLRELEDEYPIFLTKTEAEHFLIEEPDDKKNYGGYGTSSGTDFSNQESNTNKEESKKNSGDIANDSDLDSVDRDVLLNVNTSDREYNEMKKKESTSDAVIDLCNDTTSVREESPAKLQEHETIDASMDTEEIKATVPRDIEIIEDTEMIDATETKQLEECIVGKRLKTFLSEINELTTCPITRERIVNPYVGTDKYCYEREKITNWIRVHRYSPMTREMMRVQWLNQDHTMSKLIASMNDCQITDSVIQNLKCDPEDTWTKPEKPDPEDTNELSACRQKKRRKVKDNLKKKKSMVKIMKRHQTLLRDQGFFNPQNFVTSRPPKPSFSIMHVLEDGFSIVMFSGSHRVKLSPNLCLHHGNAIIVILSEWQMV